METVEASVRDMGRKVGHASKENAAPPGTQYLHSAHKAASAALKLPSSGGYHRDPPVAPRKSATGSAGGLPPIPTERPLPPPPAPDAGPPPKHAPLPAANEGREPHTAEGPTDAFQRVAPPKSRPEPGSARERAMQPTIAPLTLLPIDSAAAIEEVRRVFTVVDADQSGDIDAEELRAGLQMLGLSSVSMGEAQKVLERFDADANRRLSRQEFEKLVAEIWKFHKASQERSGSGSGAAGGP
jgi:hypothetical protein